ncbi:Pectinesterase inhibitor domain [Macleaya cordata]|uniref:Pectinesterase inhibitor domain n=1 Tax=Macleaya cordata TaxID=56857 RepID=A0A200PR91_MACCD|nr:Pectinesterase inhibitor domain [Macleaya cordata]
MAPTIQQTYLLLFAVVSISFFHYQSYAAAAAVAPESGSDDDQAMSFLEETCRHTQYYHFCISSLLSDSRSTNTYDLRGLLRISLDLSMANATHVLSYIDDVLDNIINPSSTSTLNLTSIESCGQDYDDSLTYLQWAIEAFDGIDGENYDDANDFIDDAIAGTDHCNKEIIDEELIVVKELPEPLTNMNEIMLQLLHMSQDILCYLSPDSCN